MQRPRPADPTEPGSPSKKARSTPKASGASGGAASSSSGGKKKAPTSSAIAAAANKIKQAAMSRGRPFRATDLMADMTGTQQDVMLAALQHLLSVGVIAAAGTIDKQPVFKLQTEEEAAKLRELTAEDRLVLQEIEKAGVGAISTKELRYRAGGLPQTTLTKILKKLESRQLVKPVKSVNSGNVKKYMLYGLIPSKEVTGGPWYCEGEFDYDFIKTLQRACFQFVQREPDVTAAKVHGMIRDSGLIKAGDALRTEDIDSVLGSLVYDARLEMTTPSFVSTERVYRVTPRMHSAEELARSFTSVPSCDCLTCRGRKAPSGRYVPCPNITAWLDLATAPR